MADNTVCSYVSEYFKDPHEWSYRCEGSWTMVVSLNKLKTVLRLRKHECKKSSATKDEEFNYVQEMLHNLDFAKHVVSPLMGNNYVHVGKVISIPQGFASAMNEICRGFRPEHRLDKEIDENCSSGVLMPDFCFLPSVPQANSTEGKSRCAIKTINPTFSVEIKPKCGFVPTSPFIDPARATKYSVCHYCMLQSSKVKEGKYNRESKYCPLDLFSGEPKRVMYALECLVSDPQNNLRVFCDGSAMFTEELVQKAVQEGSVCCAENYFEMSLQEMKLFLDCVTTEGCECGDSVTTECHKCSDNVTTVDHKHGDCVTSVGHSCRDDMTTEAHKCGYVGPFSTKFLDILLQILINDSKTNQVQQNEVDMSPTTPMCKKSKVHNSNIDIQGNVNCLKFGNGGVLQQLLSLQKLDDIDVEGIYPLYKKVISHFECNPGLRDKLGVDGPYNLPLWKAVASSLVSNNSRISDKSLDLNADISDQDNLYNAVLKICKFAVASTAKDCSVMIAFQKSSKKETTLPRVEMTCGDVYHYNIDLVDLDPKEFDRVVKYYKDSKNAVEIFLNKE
ncbi:inositol-pentakisphosphate 2-kinase-like [Oculina patagonica]